MAVLFAALDKDDSGEILLDEFKASLQTLNLSMNERAAAEVLASIDVDRSGTIDQLEFEAWMQHSASNMERIKTAIRIVIGLVQVLKDMPKIQKQQDKYPAEWELFGYFTPSLDLVAPCIPFSYTGLFLTNSFVVPLLLMGCVALAWFFSQRSKRPERGSQEEQEAELQRELDEVRAWELFYSWAFWQQQRERARPRGACHPSIARTTLLLLVTVAYGYALSRDRLPDPLRHEQPKYSPSYGRTEQAVATSPASVAAVATMTDELALTGSAWDADKEAAGVPSLLRSEDGRGSWLVSSEILGKLA